MRKIILIFVLSIAFNLNAQSWQDWNKWIDWSPEIRPIAEWRWNFGVTKIDTGITVIKSLVSGWKTINNQYNAQQSNSNYRPIYENGWVIFDGVDDYLDAGNVLDINTSNFTFAVWIKTGSDITNYQVILNKGQLIPNVWYILGVSNGYFHYRDGTDTTITRTFTDIPLSVNTIYFIVIEKDFSDGKVSCWINGVKSSIQYNGVTTSLSNSGTFQMGRQFTGNYYFNGSIGRVYFFNRTISEKEINILYNRGK